MTTQTKHTAHSETIERLNHMIIRLGDCRDLMLSINQRRRAPVVIETIENIARIHDRQIADLRRSVEKLGEDPETPGSLVGTVQRGLNEVRDLLFDSDLNVELDQCIVHETDALREYTKIHVGYLPPGLAPLMDRHVQEIRRVIATLTELRSSSTGTAR